MAIEVLYGRNAVTEALRAGRRAVRRVTVAAGARESGLANIIAAARQAGVIIGEAPREQLDRATGRANHQGVILEGEGYRYAALHDISPENAEYPLYLALDQLQDPQNVGTLLRSAEAVGVTGVLIPEHRAATITPAVVNASAGATEWLNIVRVTNLARELARLQEQGVWIAGLEGVPEASLIEAVDLRGALTLVLGSEGGGISRLVRERCDYLLRLPMYGQISSLNAAVAGSIALYAIDRQRRAPH